MKVSCLFYFIFLFFALSIQAQIQQKEIALSPIRFHGLQTLRQGLGPVQGYYLSHAERRNRWHIQILDTSLNEIGNQVLEAQRNGQFNEMAANGAYFLASFVSNRTANYLLLNQFGQEIKRLEREDLPFLMRGPQFQPRIFAHPQQGFILVQGVKGRDNGYSIEHLDTNLQVLWTREFSLPRGTGHVYEYRCTQEAIFLLEGNERLGNIVQTALICLDAQTGGLRYRHELNAKEQSFFPTAICPLPNGQVALTGNFYRGQRIDNRNSRGLFFLKLSEQGQALASQTFAWKALRPLLRTDVNSWFFKIMPEVWIHGLDPQEDGSFVALGELFRYGGQRGNEQSAQHHLRLLDFMRFEFNEKGEIQDAQRIHKPHLVLLIDDDNSSFNQGAEREFLRGIRRNGLQRGLMLKKYGAFTYRHHEALAKKALRLSFLNYENFMHAAYHLHWTPEETKYSFSPLVQSQAQFFSRLQFMQNFQNQYSFRARLDQSRTRVFRVEESMMLGILPARSGTMLSYEYAAFRNRLILNLAPQP